jgi:hypothetical protein
VQLVQNAPDEHTKIGSSRDAEAITDLFQLSSELKIQSVDNMTDAIIADFNGYILNTDSPEIRKILDVMPDAVGNPIRKALISAYLALSVYKVSAARETILSLLTDPDFEQKSKQRTGSFFRAFIAERIASLLKSKGPSDA